MREASSLPRRVSRVQMLALRPNGESLARATASSADATARIASTGPKVSSRMSCIEWSTCVTTAGSRKFGPRSGRRLPPVRICAPRSAASRNCCSTFSSWRSADHRADFGVGIAVEGPRRSFLVFSTHSCSKRFGDRLLDVNAFDGEAGLAAIREAAPDGGAGCDFEIGVGENDHGILAAEFEHRRNQFAGARFGDSSASGDAAGEENFFRPGFDDCGAELATALQHLHKTC